MLSVVNPWELFDEFQRALTVDLLSSKTSNQPRQELCQRLSNDISERLELEKSMTGIFLL